LGNQQETKALVKNTRVAPPVGHGLRPRPPAPLWGRVSRLLNDWVPQVPLGLTIDLDTWRTLNLIIILIAVLIPGGLPVLWMEKATFLLNLIIVLLLDLEYMSLYPLMLPNISAIYSFYKDVLHILIIL